MKFLCYNILNLVFFQGKNNNYSKMVFYNNLIKKNYDNNNFQINK